MSKSYDFIILGAGASGLMMAYRMANDSFFVNKSILIIDKEKKLLNDKTWCFWEEENGEWDALLHKKWDSIIFKSSIYNAEERIAPYFYKMIRSKDFYHKIWNFLSTKNNITFLAEEVKSIAQETENAKVITSENTYFSSRVINSILFDDSYQNQTKYPVLQQHFVGFFIKTTVDAFDDSSATFMDFDIPQQNNTRFMYVLPYSKKEALFEYTLFSSELLPYEDYKQAITKYLQEKGIENYTITEREQGSIPMTCYKFWNKNSENIIHVGTAGGWSKPSTGFTFKNTSKQTKRLLDFLKQGKALANFHKKTKFWFYDLLLLDILSEKNYLGSTLFAKMFKNVKTTNILKFLDEETSFTEDLKVILKMPPYNFVRAVFKRIF